MMETLTFLLVDDSLTYRRILRDMVGHKDHWQIIGETDNGPATLELLAALTPDVVLMDVQMPSMSGFAVTRQIRRMAQQPLIILFSGHNDEEYQRASRQSGADYYLQKEQLGDRALAMMVNAHFAEG